MDVFTNALSGCQSLVELKLLGNPLTSAALRRTFSMLCVGFPKLKYIEVPVPRECYSEDVTYPLDDSVLLQYDRELFQEVRGQLMGILAGAGRESVEVCTPLMGAYDPDINETSNELGVSMLKSFNSVLGNLIGTITDVDSRRSQTQKDNWYLWSNKWTIVRVTTGFRSCSWICISVNQTWHFEPSCYIEWNWSGMEFHVCNSFLKWDVSSYTSVFVEICIVYMVWSRNAVSSFSPPAC